MALEQFITEAFQKHFSEAPALIVRSPGRVNLIGEHTDYNDGFVLPMAIDRATWIALRPRDDRRVHFISLDFDQSYTFDLDNLQREETSPGEYVKGVAWALAESGYATTGWEGVVKGDVPIGAGLSSSAALELATARAFASLSNFEWNAAKMALVGQMAENKWVRVNTGIMDQMISAAGEAGHALLIDCRSLETEPVPLPEGTVIVVMDTTTRRGLVGSAYDERRAQCEAAAEFFGVKALRDVDMADFARRADELDDVTMRRARHVITENDRTLRARNVMKDGDAIRMGHLMIASHESMRDDFEISTDALNTMVESACEHPACYGARMTGGGFGGCAVALVQHTEVEDFVGFVAEKYTAATTLTPNIYVCQAAEGASVVKPLS